MLKYVHVHVCYVVRHNMSVLTKHMYLSDPLWSARDFEVFGYEKCSDIYIRKCVCMHVVGKKEQLSCWVCSLQTT